MKESEAFNLMGKGGKGYVAVFVKRAVQLKHKMPVTETAKTDVLTNKQGRQNPTVSEGPD